MTSRLVPVGIVLVLASIAGCSDRMSTQDAASAPDAFVVADTGGGVDGGPDAHVATDAGTDTGRVVDAFVSADGFVGFDAGPDASVSSADANVDAFCTLPPPPCAAPPPGCDYQGAGCGTCGTLVCAPMDCSPPCGATDYCDHCASSLSCTNRPTPSTGICPTIYVPVCGCDNHTYSNSCELGHAMIPEWHTGECDGIAAL